MIRNHCQECDITLSNYEKEELKVLCLDCYREANKIEKVNPSTVKVRLKNKKFFSFSKK